MYRVGRTVDIVRVHDEGVRERLGRAGELTEDEHAPFVGPCREELLSHQVHSVPERRHEPQYLGMRSEGDRIRVPREPGLGFNPQSIPMKTVAEQKAAARRYG